MPYADLDALRAERRRAAEAEPITFSLGGETFTCRDQPPLAHLLEVADLGDLDDAPLAQVVRQLAEMIDRLVIVDDRDRWRALIANPDTDLDATDLIEAAGYLSGCYLARPSTPSTGSSGGRHPDGAGSRSTPTGQVSATSPR